MAPLHLQNPGKEFANSGPRRANALLAMTAPTLPSTQQRIVAQRRKLKAKKEKARMGKEKEKVKIEHLPPKASEAALPKRKPRVKAEVIHLLVVPEPPLLPRNSEASLHLESLTDLLALDILEATAMTRIVGTGTRHPARTLRQENAKRGANVNSCMLLKR